MSTDQTPVVESKKFPSERSSSTDSPITPERLIEVNESKAMEIPKESPQVSPETDMSASYHEIFDAQILRLEEDDEDDEEAVNKRLGPLLSLDNNTASTTEYLTSKLVEDSIKWQQESKDLHSPKESPLRKRPQNLPVEEIKALTLNQKVDALDPAAIEDVEKHAKYLAACVDSMVENLSGVLQSASALTVDTLETYRDGVCKTCDEVDNNIKSMYQLMAKVEELNKSMAPAYKVGEQVKELKQLLDVYESLN